MSYEAILNSIKRQVVSPLYLFWGEEKFLLDQVVSEFKLNLVPSEVRDFNLDIIDGKDTSPEEIVNLASTLPFMADKRLLIVENAEFFKSRAKGSEDKGKRNKDDDILINYLKQPSESTCLIFITDKVDRKKKTFKAIKESGMPFEFAPLKNYELNSWIETRAAQIGKNIEPEAVAELITAIGNNLRVLDLELQKLFNYTGERKVISKEDVIQLVSKTAALSIFDLVDAVAEGSYQKAIQMMRDMITYGEPAPRLLFMVARHFRILLQTKTLAVMGYTQKQVASKIQIHPYVAQKCFKQVKNFNREELEGALEKILETDLILKTSKMEPILALELLFAQLCLKEA